MNKRKIFLLAFVLVIAAALFVGCAKFESQVDPKVHSCKVTVHANGGAMNDTEVRTFYVQEGSPLPAPAETGNIIIPKPVLTNYSIVGYYVVELGENNEILSWGDEWDFQWDHVTEDISIAVKWTRNMTYEFVGGELLDGSEDGVALPQDFAFSNAEEDLVGSVPTNNRINAPTPSKMPKASGYTFVAFYKDAACTQQITLPYSLTEDDIADYTLKADQDPTYNFPIYTQWLQGEYTLVDEAKDITNIATSTNYYFMVEADQDGNKILDMEGVSVRFPNNYSGIIEGNGCVLKNLTVTVEQSRNAVNVSAMFNNLVGAKIKNVTFDNLTVEYVVVLQPAQNGGINLANVSLFASSMDADTVLENVVISNATLKVSHAKNKVEQGQTGFVENDYECDVTFYMFGRTDDNKIGTIKTADEVQELTYNYPADAE